MENGITQLFIMLPFFIGGLALIQYIVPRTSNVIFHERNIKRKKSEKIATRRFGVVEASIFSLVTFSLLLIPIDGGKIISTRKVVEYLFAFGVAWTGFKILSFPNQDTNMSKHSAIRYRLIVGSLVSLLLSIALGVILNCVYILTK